MTDRFPVRVMVTPVWNSVELGVGGDTTVAQLKREALREALHRDAVDDDAYIVKFRGAAVLDESMTLARLGAVPNAPFIVLPARRQPVR